MYDTENIQDTSAPHGDHSPLNHIIVHLLYESGQLPRRVLLTSAIGSIQMVWALAGRYTVSIRSQKLTSHFTTPWIHSRTNRIIVHPQYGSVQLPISGPLTSAIVSVHIKGISIVAYAEGVRSRKRTSHFTTTCMGITHVQTALSCSRCTDMYSHSDVDALHQPCALYTS